MYHKFLRINMFSMLGLTMHIDVDAVFQPRPFDASA